MAYKSSKDAKLLVHGTDVSSVVSALNVKGSAVTQEFRGLGDTWPAALDTGIRKGEVSMSALYSGTTGTANILATIVGTERIVSVIFDNAAAGRAFCFQKAIVSGAEVGVENEAMHSLTPELTVTGEVNHAYVVAPFASRGANGSTDADDMDGAASSTGATAFLHVTALTGSPTSVAIKVRSSSDATTWVDCTNGAFAAVTAAGSQVIEMTGDVFQYLSIAWTWTGGTNPTWSGVVCVARD